MTSLCQFAIYIIKFVLLAGVVSSSATINHRGHNVIRDNVLLQDIVNWDQHSVFVRGERIMIFSGEFHPFRLPVPGLWLDVFQKIRALGYSAVSFYTDWALLEGTPGEFRAEGIFDLQTFFDSASEAGIYLIARPGPYINAEVSGGGFPGWLQRIKAELRSTDPEFLNATQNYITNIAGIIGKAQITNGGPVILFQTENEYTLCAGESSVASFSKCLDKNYMADVERQYREAGIVVPFTFNDAIYIGNFAPGTGVGATDVWGFDSYPMGYGPLCTDPSNWTRSGGYLLTDVYNYSVHLQQSPSSPMALMEFQGGAPDSWGGAGVESCAQLLNEEFERVMYKVNYGLATTYFNIYMTFGGTNWGNLGHPEAYTSYDLGAAISEDRRISREKYSEMKLEASFLQASPAYLTSLPSENDSTTYTNTSEVLVTPLLNSPTNFYVVRQTDYTSQASVTYTLKVPTSVGNISIPQLGGSLVLHGRDSKIHVTDYDVGGVTLIYSSAEVFTWRKHGSKSVLILYGGENEMHELALPAELGIPAITGEHRPKVQQLGSSIVIQWNVLPTRRILSFGDRLDVYLLWRNDAYNYWVLDLPASPSQGRYVSASGLNSSVVVKAGYLMRNASISTHGLHLYGDVNATTEIEVISGVPSNCSTMFFNGKKTRTVRNSGGRLTAVIPYEPPSLKIPSLPDLDWRYMDSLPELKALYNDSLWTECNNTTTNNPRNLTTPVSLYAGDYGYHSGSLIYRGKFTSKGSNTTIFHLNTQGGSAFGNSVWINDTFLGSWKGNPGFESQNQTFTLPASHTGDINTFTIVIDHMGLNEETYIGSNTMKSPRGILDYSLSTYSQSEVTWKLTGNLGGENYIDKSRGPLNEGAMFAERHGYHLPGTPTSTWTWKKRSPFQGITRPGIGFFAAEFELSIPEGFDVPLSFVFANVTGNKTESDNGKTSNFRCQLFVNGFQFGKYVNNLGPQTSFPVPEGILNYNGTNYISLTLWSLEATGGARLGGFELESRAVIFSGYSRPEFVKGSTWRERSGVY